MKKIFKMTTITVIILILVIILFCSKINEISIIESIKQKIAKTEEIQNTSEVTTIDVTNLEENGNLGHEHIFKTMYDENTHWEECTVCGQKNNETNHIYKDQGWTMGDANNCHRDNVHEFVCLCGYEKKETKGRKDHVWKKINNEAYYSYHEYCSDCNSSVTRNKHQCVNNKNGRVINCTNLGICSICGFNYKNVRHLYSNVIKSGDNMFCTYCNTYLGVVNDTYISSTEEGKFIYYSSITVPDGSVYSEPGCYTFDPNVSISNSPKRNGNIWENTQTGNYIAHSEICSTTRINYYFNINGSDVCMYLNANIQPESIQPTITDITNSGTESLIEWSRTKPIVISGTENYCNTVTVKIIDDKEQIIFEGVGEVFNKNYQVQCIPEIECDTNGRIFTVTVTDSLENSISQEFTIAKVDSIPPTPTSESEILGEWAKSKDFTFTATDYGIGQVSIAFNDIEDLQLAKVNENTYSRDYKFTGDVYKPKQLSVMYRDGLGNTQVQKITIDKIDNTAPSITNTELHNSIITIISHDEHKTLGEGSGVIKYRYLASEEKIENPKLTTENSTEILKDEEIKIKDIYKMKYIYAVAEDYVGNISEVYEFKVPELKLTATANPNTTNGKGEIILDWSSYDVVDKYFVIYRKEENQEEWEIIVSLEEKFNRSSYVDNLANDKKVPNAPNIVINGNGENNSINISASSGDNGTKYTYYIEAYDSTGTLLSKSN